MRFGLNIVPVRPAELGELAVRAEELGFESLWSGEHVLTPVELGDGYPSGPKPPFAPDSRFTEPFATLSFLASVTQRVRLGTGVLILPLHPVVPLARAIATVDVFSGGRLSLGLGAGWMREEFAAVGQGFTDRGRRMDEMLTVLDLLFGQDRPSFEGKFHQLPPMGFEPKPVQRPHPPFLIGGSSAAALRRAARVGDGWYGSQDPPDKLAPVIAQLHRLRAGYGRDGLFEITALLGWGQEFDADLVRAYADAGVHRLVVTPWARSREAPAGIDRFARAAGI
ncbi:TIGR03619 family F420-dependent LLM class oxidoreductase [Amycolatopsis acidiphila]|uniref:TIGR03619 family F420-dependent LLM class oxidoreductase n=1 Tax=Amycolatopsis acidiphila TaxID=715473 RepID=A0A558AB24_9PSEU|nr:TIGR03619 family F420-dependent LLM class oxidoreductase [Amycolatopsis acidiphila]TVT21434.1 TIGR03619 family F420-dependent LLM class oxidoreductase [Amycolatopsis acidiphila]UIJ63106.1 TIGR03619 family F420-dependent LLM class oxidoreductase [Amycolatopsis acidiphila]GHG73769.1 hypothetical protein GCM10017788_37080 [Amycolatopsis acidiphila]